MLLPAHAGEGPQSRSAEAVETAVHWLHSVSALGWGLSVAAVTVLAVPRLRRVLSPAALRRLDAKLEALILGGAACTAVLIVTGVYNLKKTTPYPTPFLSEPWSTIKELPDAKAYFATLALKLVLYVGMLAGAGLIIRRARELSEVQTEVTSERVLADSGGGTAVLVAPPPTTGTTPMRWSPALIAGGGAAVLLCVSLLGTLHLRIEGTAAAAPEDPLSATHASGLSPVFSKVGAKAAGKDAWDVTLTLTDLHTKDTISSLLVTVTGRSPAGAEYGPVDFRSAGKGNYVGRVTGPRGAWELFAIAVGKQGVDVPPTQQSFRLQLGPK